MGWVAQEGKNMRVQQHQQQQQAPVSWPCVEPRTMSQRRVRKVADRAAC